MERRAMETAIYRGCNGSRRGHWWTVDPECAAQFGEVREGRFEGLALVVTHLDYLTKLDHRQDQSLDELFKRIFEVHGGDAIYLPEWDYGADALYLRSAK